MVTTSLTGVSVRRGIRKWRGPSLWKRYLPCSRLSMDNETLPRDDDPSEMTDFEKNTTLEEREQFEQDPPRPDQNRIRQERGSEGSTRSASREAN